MEGTAAETTRSAAEWLQLVGIGMLLGALGQAARSVIGLKKLNDEAAEKKRDLAELFSASKLVVSLIIGATAGAMSSLFVITDLARLSTEQVIGLAAAGYLGADVIEALMNRILPQTPNLPAGPPVVAAVQPQFIAVQAPAPAVAGPVDDYQG